MGSTLHSLYYSLDCAGCWKSFLIQKHKNGTRQGLTSYSCFQYNPRLLRLGQPHNWRNTHVWVIQTPHRNSCSRGMLKWWWWGLPLAMLCSVAQCFAALEHVVKDWLPGHRLACPSAGSSLTCVSVWFWLAGTHSWASCHCLAAWWGVLGLGYPYKAWCWSHPVLPLTYW